MSSWVRYCVAVYIGLLISGALARPPWTYPSAAQPAHTPAPTPGVQYNEGWEAADPPADAPANEQGPESIGTHAVSDTLAG